MLFEMLEALKALGLFVEFVMFLWECIKWLGRACVDHYDHILCVLAGVICVLLYQWYKRPRDYEAEARAGAERAFAKLQAAQSEYDRIRGGL